MKTDTYIMWLVCDKKWPLMLKTEHEWPFCAVHVGFADMQPAG